MNKKVLGIFLFTAILLVAVFLRLFLLGSVPAGLTNDEANTGYDAYSLLHTGKDQWGQTLPLVFRGFGDYPPPLYRYLAIPFIANFGLDSFALRLPSAFFGILSVVVIFFLVKKVFNQTTAFFAMAFLAFSPWAIGLSRVALESNVAACFLLLGLLTFFYSNKNTKLCILSCIFFALTLYTYSAYTLFSPLLLLILILHKTYAKEFSYKYSLLLLIVFGLLIAPLFLGRNTSAAARFSQVGILHNVNSIGLVNILNDQRGACIHYMPSALCTLENNKTIVFATTLLKNYVSHFSVDFLFLSGNETQYSILPQRGLEYLLSCIFLIVGAFSLTRKKSSQKLFLIFLLLSPIPDSLTGGGNYSRAFVMAPFLAIAESVGAYVLFEKVREIKQVSIRYATFLVTFLLLFVGVASFITVYFTYFHDNYSRFSQYGYQQLMMYVKQQQTSYKNIYITTLHNDAKQYIYYLFYTKFDPKEYQSKKNIAFHTTPDGWVSIDAIGNIHFIALADTKDIQKGDVFISHPSDFPTCPGIFSVKDRVGYEEFRVVLADTFPTCIKKSTE